MRKARQDILSDEQKLKIIRLYKNEGITQSLLAERFGVTQEYISVILKMSSKDK